MWKEVNTFNIVWNCYCLLPSKSKSYCLEANWYTLLLSRGFGYHFWLSPSLDYTFMCNSCSMLSCLLLVLSLVLQLMAFEALSQPLITSVLCLGFDFQSHGSSLPQMYWLLWFGWFWFPEALIACLGLLWKIEFLSIKKAWHSLFFLIVIIIIIFFENKNIIFKSLKKQNWNFLRANKSFFTKRLWTHF